MKYTYEEVLEFLKSAETGPDCYSGKYARPHSELGKAVCLHEEIVSYDEGMLQTFSVYQFENCDEPIGYSTFTNSWDEGFEDFTDFSERFNKVEKRMAETWFTKET